MLKKITIVTLAICFLTMLSLVSAQNATDSTTVSLKKTALIIQDSSKLEISVTRILKDTLSKIGYDVKDIPIASIGNEKASDYTVSIVFSAIKAGSDSDPAIRKFVASKAGSLSQVKLFTVYGNVYSKGKRNVDATSEATKALHPKLVADRVLKSLQL
jgi:hypothetical protein